jgi:hypothetical protein
MYNNEELHWGEDRIKHDILNYLIIEFISSEELKMEKSSKSYEELYRIDFLTRFVWKANSKNIWKLHTGYWPSPNIKW